MGGASNAIPLVLYGATGRMGRSIRAVLLGDKVFSLQACVARGAERARSSSTPPADACAWLTPDALAGERGLTSWPDDLVVVDVSLADGLPALLSALERSPRALVAASTGLDGAGEERLRAYARRAPVLRAPNLSLGIAVVSALLRALPPGARGAFDADIVEHHHAAKRDAPSGTAKALAALLEGVGTPRRAGGVALHSIRGGSAPGTHEVVLSGEGEIVTVGHLVHDRAVFARGALLAARFLHRKPAALYTFEDALT